MQVEDASYIDTQPWSSDHDDNVELKIVPGDYTDILGTPSTQFV
jgi:hypothetical protein